jgi:pimeloyl-ACP methyl ester carboxylesterase
VIGLALAMVLAHAAPASWTGSFTLGGPPVQIAVAVHGSSATVSLGPGHASATTVRLGKAGFSFPGLPENVVFSGRRTATRWAGTVRQGAAHGSFGLRPGTAPAVSALGLYRSEAGATVAIVRAKGFPPWLVELPSGATHGLNPTLTTVGTLLGETSGDGPLTVDPRGVTWSGRRYRRVALRQWEVRIGRIAGTLTLPAGRGPFAAAVMVHGSDPNGRDEFQTFAAYLESLGVGVLAADKRGRSLRDFAADAAAQVDFLASRRSVDPARVGLLGDSQAGWTIAIAAARDPRVRWAVLLVGPTTTVGETDLFTSLAGAEQTPPAGTRAEMISQVRAAGPSGYDPLPALRKLTIPVLWVFGDDDRNVPTELCVERLESIRAGHEFSWAVLHMTHALIDLPNGLYSSLPRSRGFTATLFPTVGRWLTELWLR